MSLHGRVFAFLSSVALLSMVGPSVGQTGVNVTTWHNDNWRTGQ